MKFKKVASIQPRLADGVYEQILSAIVNGEIEPGERLIQEQIAEAINVSRTPVREALLRLEQEGILIQVGRKGFSIREMSEQSVREIYGAREAIEGYAAWAIATERSANKLAKIRLSIDAEKNAGKGTMEEDFSINRNIHRTIAEQTGNLYLLEMFDKLWFRGLSLWMFAATRRGELEPDPTSHMKLYEILADGSAEEAYSGMIMHVREGVELHISQI
jgi:DNA-binding GntR family transcriptional regulator